MNKALEILRIKLQPDDRNFAKLLSVQATITGQILSATARLRGGDLKDDVGDPVEAFLAEVREADTPAIPDDYAALFA